MNRRGQSLIEVLVATVVGGLMILAAITLIAPSLKTGGDVQKIQAGAAMGKELFDNVRAAAEADWHNLSNLATSSANTYFVAGSSPFIIATGTETVLPEVLDGLVGHWKFDEGSSTRAFDSFANNSGTWSGSGTHYATTSRASGYAGRFGTSTGDTISLPAMLTGNASFTVSAWVYTTSTSQSWKTVMAEGCTGFDLTINNASVMFGRNCGVPGVFYNGGAISSGVWTHLTMTYDGTTASLYKDAALSATGTVSYTHAAAYIGSYNGSNEVFAGQIDDVRLYNRTLASSEISKIYKGTYFTRYFYVEDVYRSSTGTITSVGTYDPSTLKVTVGYSWQNGPTNTIVGYVTRSKNNRAFIQTDWTGGPNQTSSITNANSKFSTSSNVDHTTTTGSVILSNGTSTPAP